MKILSGDFWGGPGITEIVKPNGISWTGRSKIGDSMTVIKEMGNSRFGKSLTGVTERERSKMGKSQTGTKIDGEVVIGGEMERAWARALIS